mmetsp:Transcript_32958/g.68661  ORF Transcript_32958/g.68661 Transcript_32958/m.68661 type:complete len:138 (-) Transcript_32958:1282-1695(-)
MQSVATPRAPVDTPKAPARPNLLIDKNTLTTKTFNGIPNRFMITERWESGTYLLRKVPIDGKYIPTQASKAKKEATIVARLAPPPALTDQVATDMATVAIDNMAAAKFSVLMFIFAIWPKMVDPNKHEAMKHEKTVP